MTNWQSADVVSNGIRVHYYRTGGDKPVVVLCHGVTDNGLCWSPVAHAIEQQYDVVMVDARGHGLSEAPATGYNYRDMAADLGGLIVALGLGRPVLVGHSMGAETVAACAAAYPHLVRGIALCDPPWRADLAARTVEERAVAQNNMRAQILRRRSMTVQQIIAAGRAEHPEWPEAEWEPWAQAKLQVSPDVSQLMGGTRSDWRQVVARIECPILLITADPQRGAIVTPEVAAEARGLWRQGTVVHIPGAGHSIRREQFARYLEAVRAFLATF